VRNPGRGHNVVYHEFAHKLENHEPILDAVMRDFYKQDPAERIRRKETTITSAGPLNRDRRLTR
jgi:Mlc titration factor MtfA (ptsG expression regulator)